MWYLNQKFLLIINLSPNSNIVVRFAAPKNMVFHLTLSHYENVNCYVFFLDVSDVTDCDLVAVHNVGPTSDYQSRQIDLRVSFTTVREAPCIRIGSLSRQIDCDLNTEYEAYNLC